MKAKIIGSSMVLLSIGLFIAAIIGTIKGNYQYENKYYSYWSLAEKASTITKKAEYVDKFVAAIKSSNLQGKYGAIFYETPDNSFDYNFEALLTLQQRLHEISTMNVSSFEYQTAIQQITGQEQGEAGQMLCEFESIWWKEHCIMLWNWVGVLNMIGLVIILMAGIFILIEWTD